MTVLGVPIMEMGHLMLSVPPAKSRKRRSRPIMEMGWIGELRAALGVELEFGCVPL